MTEASRTTLVTLGRLTAFGEELVDQRHAGLHVMPRTTLGPLHTEFHGRNAQLIVGKPHDELVAGVDTQRLTKGRRNDDASIFIDSQPRFSVHAIPPLQ